MEDPTPPVEEPTTPTPEPVPSGGLGGGLPPAEPAPAGTVTDYASEEVYSAFRASLPEDIRDHNTFSQTKNLQELAKQTLNAQSALGKKRTELPQEDWKDDQYAAYYDQIRPTTADDYTALDTLEVVRDGEDIKVHEFSEETNQQLKESAHRLGLSPHQFKQFQQEWAQNGVIGEAMIDEQISDAVKVQQNELRTKWGADHELNHRQANEAYDKMVTIIPELEDLIAWSPLVANHPATMQLFHRLAPLVNDLNPVSGGSGTGFNNADTVVGITNQIQSMEQTHGKLLYADANAQASMTPQDKQLRARLLEERTALYAKKYPTKV
jgi:hypothetical protein